MRGFYQLQVGRQIFGFHSKGKCWNKCWKLRYRVEYYYSVMQKRRSFWRAYWITEIVEWGG